MPAIGYVTKQANGGYKGQLKTLGIRAEIEIVPNTSKDPASNQPDFVCSPGAMTSVRAGVA